VAEQHAIFYKTILMVATTLPLAPQSKQLMLKLVARVCDFSYRGTA